MAQCVKDFQPGGSWCPRERCRPPSSQPSRPPPHQQELGRPTKFVQVSGMPCRVLHTNDIWLYIGCRL